MIARTAQRSFSKTENRLENTVSRMCASAANWAGGQGTTPVPSPRPASACAKDASSALRATPPVRSATRDSWGHELHSASLSLFSSLLSLFKL